jgi:DtxR family Mn-dependent transcriptional regulator
MLNNLSTSAENFMKAIFMHEQYYQADIKIGSVAKALGITGAAATDMARKLAERKLIGYEKYRKLELTPEGKRIALNLIRKHRLWETFLYTVFQMSLHEIHQEAELLEHHTSEFLADKMSSYLGDPAVDPHGDPIPSVDGEMDINDGQVPLSLAEQGKSYTITRLAGAGREFFDFCKRNNISVGAALTVEKQYTDYPMSEIKLGQVCLLLNADFSNFIYVEPLS